MDRQWAARIMASTIQTESPQSVTIQCRIKLSYRQRADVNVMKMVNGVMMINLQNAQTLHILLFLGNGARTSITTIKTHIIDPKPFNMLEVRGRRNNQARPPE